MKKTNPLLQRLHGSSVVVAGALDAQTIIEDPSTAPAVKGVLSIADPPGYAQHIRPKLPDAPTHVRLDFLDRINPGYGGPEREHVERILAWGRQFPEFFTGKQRIGYGGPLNDCGPKSLVLIHCFAGISRSTASAYVCFAQALGPGREKEAAEMLVRSSLETALYDLPLAPNELIVEHAETILNRDKGSLQRAIARIVKE